MRFGKFFSQYLGISNVVIWVFVWDCWYKPKIRTANPKNFFFFLALGFWHYYHRSIALGVANHRKPYTGIACSAFHDKPARGKIAGVGKFLKEQNQLIKIGLADPEGSALFSYYQVGELKSDGNSISEGIGQGRITANLAEAPIDMAFCLSDHDALPLIFDLMRDEGLYLGGSTAINVAGAVEMAREMGPGHTIVTILCDSGQRYQSKVWNPEFLKSKDLPIPSWL